jgi:hypothetical protein
MYKICIRRPLRLVIPLLAAGVGPRATPTQAAAAVQTFHRFEVEAMANHTVIEQCPDGWSAAGAGALSWPSVLKRVFPKPMTAGDPR